MHRLLTLIATILITVGAVAQNRSIKVVVVNAAKKTVPFTSIKVVTAADTVTTFEKITDSNGVAKFQLLQGGQYILRASSVGYKETIKQILITGDNTFTLTLAGEAKSLATVTVTASKPLMRQEEDKTIVDAEVLATQSTNAYEILEKTPGLFVDQDGNVYLSSTTPAKIYINGREQRMSTTDIATMLRSLPPNSIQSIEILRTPSAKYDASGAGGVVNIILKKGVRIAFTGSVNAGMNQGVYGNEFAGINLNNSSGNSNSYLNINYTRRNSYDQIRTDRIFNTDSLLSQDAYTRYPQSSLFVGAGLGYTINKRWELNYDGRYNLNTSNNNTVNTSDIKKISNNKLLTSNVANVVNNLRGSNITQSLSGKYKIDSIGSEWTTDVSYTGNPNTTNQSFTTDVIYPINTSLSGTGNIKTSFNYYSLSSNLLLKFARKFSIETGFKSTFINFRNNSDYFKVFGNSRIEDSSRTTAYQYNENINAGYLQASKNISGITVKAGVRVENTNMDGKQLVPKDTSFNIHRTDPFPYVYISKDLMKIMGYQLRAYLVYRRTITRPGYEMLNPLPRYIDPFLSDIGNPSLRPQFTKNYEFNISVDERPIFAIGSNDTKDIFNNVIYQADSTKAIAYRTYDNLGTNKEFYLRGLGAIPGRKYFAVAGAQYNRNFYQGLYQGKPLSFRKGSWSIFTYQTLKLGSNTQLALHGFARFNGQLQFYELSSFGSLNFSLNQQFLNKKLMVTLNVTDIFFTNNNHFSLQQGAVYATGYREADTRRFGINVRYNFGFKKKEEKDMFDLNGADKAGQ